MKMLIDTKNQRVTELSCDFCVVGGGLSGLCAAIAAARGGAKVVLMQDRPVLGGNCSSEIRMWVRGASGRHNRETGILSELEEENIYRNPTLNYSLWDSVLYEKVRAEQNITLLLNCTCLSAEAEGGRVRSVTGWQLNTYTFFVVSAPLFADCSGDSVLAPLVGAEYRMGREGNDEYGERIGPAVGDDKTMGMSCLIQARETDRPVPFIAPEWANVYETDEDFDYVARGREMRFYGRADNYHAAGNVNKLTRDHDLATSGTNFWWIEVGGDRDAIHDADLMRDELLKISLGIWDHIKNRGDHHADNWALEWIGFLPGKRESRRYVGDHVLTQNDIESGGHFPDLVAYGGWTMDDHNPAGFYSGADQPPSLQFPAPSPYGIPYRCLYSKNIGNLFFAGRNISATHAALSSTRVMATCSLLGQAVGTAAALCVRHALASPRAVYEGHMEELRRELREAGCYLPFSVREIPALSRQARLNLTKAQREVLFDGWDRPQPEGDHCIELPLGGKIAFTFDTPTPVRTLRVMFDPDFSRESVSVNRKMRVFAQTCNVGLDFEPMKVARTLVKRLEVVADDEVIFTCDHWHNALLRLPIGRAVRELKVRLLETWGSETVRIYSCDIQ